MEPEVSILTRLPGEEGPLARSWNELPAGRGTQADLYDHLGWLRAWTEADPGGAAALLIPAVTSGPALLAALPLVARSTRRWEAAALRFRPRYRVIAAGGEPDRAHLARLADAIARAGVRELDLPLMPSRDPATAALLEALRGAGYAVRVRTGTADCLAPAAEPWEVFKRRYRKYERTVRNFTNKASRLGEVAFESYGRPDAPVLEGYRIYLALHERGWKGTIGPAVGRLRERLLAWAERRRLVRLHVLRVAGVPAAAIIWFRVGAVATAYSTVYDRRMAALSAGTIVMWRGLEREFDGAPPGLVDFLPGRGPQKDQLGTERPPLLTVCAVRARSAVRLAAPVRHAAERLKGAVRRKRRRGSRAEPPAATRPIVARPEAAAAGVEAAPLPLDGAWPLYLAVATGAPSVGVMRKSWERGDTWWRVGEPPRLLVRLGAPEAGERRVREVVLIGGAAADPEEALAGLASASGTAVRALWPEGHGAVPSGAAVLHRAVLPCPS